MEFASPVQYGDRSKVLNAGLLSLHNDMKKVAVNELVVGKNVP